MEYKNNKIEYYSSLIEPKYREDNSWLFNFLGKEISISTEIIPESSNLSEVHYFLDSLVQLILKDK